MRKDPTILIMIEPVKAALDKLRDVCPGSDIRTTPMLEGMTPTYPAEPMRGAEIVLSEFPPVNFDDFDKIKWLQLTSAGYSHILHLPLVDRGIRVTNGLGNFDIPIAEWNIMTMLMCHRNMLQMLENQRNSLWDRDAKFQGEMRGMTVGFYGYGGIARETARLARAMGLVVWTLTRDGSTADRGSKYAIAGTGDSEGTLPDRVFKPTELKEFLGGVDFLVLSMPLTNATRGLMGEKELRMLKPTAVLINPARAQIVEEQALLRCLREKWIKAAAIDVHYAYPLPAEHPLWTMPNLILTPHISGSSASPHFLSRIYDIFVQNVERYCKGQPLLNELTEAQLRGQ